ncbi:conserved hypothetical protein [Ricinus communis]|uniref:Uncharacterized protein n=1 Tax=Ricinus communis TaxID=3988 RepID=B9SZV6_RICCO|nr:conserved hypothetical protein [Ricinus communis]|eukprot:XP_015582315.1 uncharacterized protein LOC8258361 [Ricinus communis]
MQSESENSNILTLPALTESSPMSPQPSSSDISSVSETSIATAETTNTSLVKCETLDSSLENFPVIDEDFWSEPEFVENYNVGSNVFDELQLELPREIMEAGRFGNNTNIIDDGMDFWYNVFVKAGGIEEFV